ncbi:MAG TPA: hypothetical protein VNB90_11715 [Cytophagaceae bacterium]|jgi:hypothetical protein|nr:hypothetical protein [Cytophagaceae bacterium]
MIEIFKTNVQEATEANKLAQLLLEHFPDSKINFDLEDCDRILRIESEKIDYQRIIFFLNSQHFFCEVLTD